MKRSVATATQAGSGSRTFVRLAVRFRLLVTCLAVLALLLAFRGRIVQGSGGTPQQALTDHLALRGLVVDPQEIMWLAPAKGSLGLRPALMLARHEGELRDVYYCDVRASAEGPVLDVAFLTNLTRSSSADESQLVQLGDHAAFAVQVGESYDALVMLDMLGEPEELTAEWPRHSRMQNAVTNLQETGRAAGIGRHRYHLVPPARSLELASERGRLRVLADGEPIVIEPGRMEPLEGAARVRAQESTKGRPGLITWAVDTVRNLSFVGPEPIEWLEHTVFGVTDRAKRAYYGWMGEDVEATEAEVAEALAVPELLPEKKALLTVTDPELGWPPPPLAPLLQEEVRGEGQWLPVVDDPFLNDYPNAPPAFYQTFIRVDAERPFTRVYITMWDSRQVQLHIAMGTREPESATGETGSGMIPRDPELLRRLVGGFNGGFQALHGEFGMMAEGRVYLPPKPFAATVAVHEDGRVGIGSWPGPGRGGWDEERANRQIPEDMVAMRQNLTSVVEGERYNPWKRWWWGAAPEWAEEQTYIHRSGLCVTAEGFLAYLWGESMGPEELGKAMLATRCVRGIHLDMNSKHTGLELYRPIAVPGVHVAAAPKLGRALDPKSEFEGALMQAEGVTFRARKAIKTMTPLRFPRYLERDPRDFFFLSLKPVLPGPDLAIGTQRVPFQSHGLPHAGWPPAFARARIAGADGEGSWLVRADPARAVPAAIAGGALEQPLAHLLPLKLDPEAGAGATHALYLDRGPSMLRRYRVGAPPEGATVILRGPALSSRADARAALGIDGEGFLLYAEAGPGEGAAVLSAHLARAGVERAIALERMAFSYEGKSIAVGGEDELETPGQGAVALMAETRMSAEVLNPEVEPRPYRRWGWLQGQRVRYFPDPERSPRFRQPEPPGGDTDGKPAAP